jgi:glycolate oxidase
MVRLQQLDAGTARDQAGAKASPIPTTGGRVATPDTAADVQAVVRDAARAGTRIAVHRPAPAGAIELRLDGLDRILEIDAADLVARVEPGVRLGALAATLRERGLRFVPADGPFHAERTVGEVYARGLANARSLRHGAAKHLLLGSRVVLASGELLATGGRTVKNVTGYDLTRFFHAPSASLGIAVELVLKLHPIAPATRTIAVRLASAVDCVELAGGLRDAAQPAYLLWADPEAQALATGAPARGHAVLLELEGMAEEVRDAVAQVNAAVERLGGAVDEVAPGELRAAALPFDRDAGAVLGHELRLDPQALPAFAGALAQAAQANGERAGAFGSPAEGRLAVRVGHAAGADLPLAVLAAASAADARLVGQGPLAPAPPAALREVERRLAARLDPGGILTW